MSRFLISHADPALVGADKGGMAQQGHPRLLVFGASGQLGRSLSDLGGGLVRGLSRDDVDLELCDGDLAATICSADVDVVVNAAAWTNVDAAETDADRAMAINGSAPGRIAEACRRAGLPLIHISTDYVFAGEGDHAWREDDTVGPLNVYGRSKLQGERAVLAAWPLSLVIRTSWLFSEHGPNFVTAMLTQAHRSSLRVVHDQTAFPTDALDLARFIFAAAQPGALTPERCGLLHFRGTGRAVSRAEFAEEIFEALPGDKPEIQRISSHAFGALAARPRNSQLDIARLERTWGFRPAEWNVGLSRVIAKMAS